MIYGYVTPNIPIKQMRQRVRRLLWAVIARTSSSSSLSTLSSCLVMCSLWRFLFLLSSFIVRPRRLLLLPKACARPQNRHKKQSQEPEPGTRHQQNRKDANRERRESQQNSQKSASFGLLSCTHAVTRTTTSSHPSRPTQPPPAFKQGTAQLFPPHITWTLPSLPSLFLRMRK
jgi:hypothetical protein